jgi:hypothetical protein
LCIDLCHRTGVSFRFRFGHSLTIHELASFHWHYSFLCTVITGAHQEVLSGTRTFPRSVAPSQQEDWNLNNDIRNLRSYPQQTATSPDILRRLQISRLRFRVLACMFAPHPLADPCPLRLFAEEFARCKALPNRTWMGSDDKTPCGEELDERVSRNHRGEELPGFLRFLLCTYDAETTRSLPTSEARCKTDLIAPHSW